MENRPSKRERNLWFLLILGVVALLCWRTVGILARLSLNDDRYSYIVLIPIISAGILWWKRDTIFRDIGASFGWGVSVSLIGGLLYCVITKWPPFADSGISLAVSSFAMVLMLAGGFLLCFGLESAKQALFPLAFLLLMIPVPAPLLARAVAGLQEGSAQTTAVLFHMLGVPVVRHGMKFSLPGVDIEVAEQCSGIRSSLSLFISGLVASYLLLHSAGTRIFLSLITIPVAIFKNGVRIVTLSWLGVYVDPGFLHGKLHQYSGLPVSVLALAILGPLALGLRRLEATRQIHVTAESPRPVEVWQQ